MRNKHYYIYLSPMEQVDWKMKVLVKGIKLPSKCEFKSWVGLGCAEKVMYSSSVEETSNITKTDKIDRIKQYGVFSNKDNRIGTQYLHGMNKEFIAKIPRRLQQMPEEGQRIEQPKHYNDTN